MTAALRAYIKRIFTYMAAIVANRILAIEREIAASIFRSDP